ncbi:MAG: transketolase [Streptomycetaceae bacterium]|nr:transketolase [Streptomycetaceae bacterium]
MTAAPTNAVIGPRSDLAEVFELAQQLRVDSIRASTSAGSGHPTSSMSAADLMAVLLARHLHYDWQRPEEPGNDHLVFSKGHASPLLYSMFTAAGVVSEEELLTAYRRTGSRLQGHPTPTLPWVDVATGSLGQGLPYGVGLALAGRKLDHVPYRVWVLCGDSEMTEGSMWEALDKAGRYGLVNLTAIVDVNRLGQRGPTELGWDLEVYANRVESFGCAALTVEGHDVAAVDKAFEAACRAERPTVVLARTIKGRGFAEVEDAEGWHGKPLPREMAARAIAGLGGVRHLRVRGPGPRAVTVRQPPKPGTVELPRFEPGEKVATRSAYGKALAAMGARPEVVALDAEVGNSTHAEDFGHVYPGRYVQTFIAEQQMLATAVGLAVRGRRPYAATFAAFLTRAHDFIRMASVSGVSLALCGSHCGVEIGADGPSQMGLEDIAMMRSVHGSTVLYPSDATSAAALTAAMADMEGISYIRTTRGAYPVLYPPQEPFPVGGSKTLRSGPEDQVTLVGAGVTLHECLAAADELAEEGVHARVIDLYSVKPVDGDALCKAARETGAMVVTEDHHPEGGMGEAVLHALVGHGTVPRFVGLAVEEMPGSGPSAELLAAAGVSRAHIAEAARRLLAG